ncbi:cation diffusion facilitator family protein 1-like isoform X2 [Convolutriloba macropyga]|uniref:cation diffusion facilitator family protein 1-like isoform X2 n=1 Tax=Convolutriloba macropyga TaxID=536237 RepID=UPI003F51B8CF
MGCRKRRENFNPSSLDSPGDVEFLSRKRSKKPVHHSKSFKLIFQLVLTGLFFFVELIVGYIGNSMALVADSFHMLSDVISLIIGLLAVRMASKRSPKNTFGWVRAEVLGALVNSVFLLALCFSIFIESIKRIIEPEPVQDADLVLYVGLAGLFINIIGMFIFSHHHAHDHGGRGHGHGHHHHHRHGHSHQHHDHKLSKRDTCSNDNMDQKDNGDWSADEDEAMMVDNHKQHLDLTEQVESTGQHQNIPGTLSQAAKDNDSNATKSSDTVNSRSALSPHDEDNMQNDTESEATASPPIVSTMNPQLTAPSFTCYICRSCVPTASRSLYQPNSCFNCAETNVPSVIAYPIGNAKTVQMNGMSKNKEVEHSEKTCRKKKGADQMNIRGVFLHILGDFLGSIIVCATAGTLMMCERYQFCGDICENQPLETQIRVPCWTFYLDPCLSICMVIIILSSTIPLLKESAFILLQTVPTHIRIDKVQSELLEQVPSIKGMHELHVWQLAGNRIIASAHVQCESPQEYMQMANDIKSYFHDMGIHSTTIQPEFTQQNQLEYQNSGGELAIQVTNETASSEGDNARTPANSRQTSDSSNNQSSQQSSHSVVRSSSGDKYDDAINNRECLLTCGPEKSCTDEVLCCPRDLKQELRNSLKRKKKENNGNGLNGNAAGRLLTDVSLDLTGISNQAGSCSHVSTTPQDASKSSGQQPQFQPLSTIGSGSNKASTTTNSLLSTRDKDSSILEALTNEVASKSGKSSSGNISSNEKAMTQDLSSNDLIDHQKSTETSMQGHSSSATNIGHNSGSKLTPPGESQT